MQACRRKLFEETVAALNIGARLEISRVTRSGITATKVDVFAHGEKELPREVFWSSRAGLRDMNTGTNIVTSMRHEHVELREHNYSQSGHEGTRAGVPAPHQRARDMAAG